MYPVERALWFIENRIAGDISLQACQSAFKFDPRIASPEDVTFA